LIYKKFLFLLSEFLSRPIDKVHLANLRKSMLAEPGAQTTSILMPDPKVVPDMVTWVSRTVDEWIADEDLE